MTAEPDYRSAVKHLAEMLHEALDVISAADAFLQGFDDAQEFALMQIGPVSGENEFRDALDKWKMKAPRG